MKTILVGRNLTSPSQDFIKDHDDEHRLKYTRVYSSLERQDRGEASLPSRGRVESGLIKRGRSSRKNGGGLEDSQSGVTGPWRENGNLVEDTNREPLTKVPL